MTSAKHSHLFRGGATLIFIALVLSLTWNLSPFLPEVHDSNSTLLPVAYSNDGKYIAAVGTPTAIVDWMRPSGPIQLLNTVDLTPIGPSIDNLNIGTEEAPIFRGLEAVEFSPDGETLAVVCQEDHNNKDGNLCLGLYLINLSSREIFQSLSIPYDKWNRQGGVFRKLFSGDGRLLAWHEFEESEWGKNSNKPHKVRTWDIAANRECFVINDATYPVFSPDGNWLAALEESATTPGSIACNLYSAHSGTLISSFVVPGKKGWQPWPEFSPDNRFLATNTRDSGEIVTVIDIASGQTVFQNEEWSPHFVGNKLVTVQDDSVILRSTEDWRVNSSATFSLGKSLLDGSAISPDPSVVPGIGVVMVYDTNRFGGYRANLLDTESREVTSFTVSNHWFCRTILSPDGTRLVLLDEDGISIWKLPPYRRTLFPIFIVTVLMIAARYGLMFVFKRTKSSPSQ